MISDVETNMEIILNQDTAFDAIATGLNDWHFHLYALERWTDQDQIKSLGQ